MYVQQQSPINVYYDERIVGEYFADLLVDGCIIIELEVAEKLHPRHEAQLLNYLKATDIEVGLLVSFGTKLQFTRKAHSNKHKN